MYSYPASRRARFSPGTYLAVFGLIAVLLILPILGNLPAPAAGTLGSAPAVASVLGQLPLAFIPSGQNQPAAHFEVYGAGNKLTFSPQEISLDLSGSSQPLRLSFVDANREPQLAAGELLPTRVNDYRGQEARNWRTSLPAYAGITYQELYPGIELHYEGKDGSLKSTFRLAPGADAALIRWQYAGTSAVAVDQVSGDLLVTLPDQTQVVERAPLAWQEINGQRLPVQVAYALSAGNTITFSLGSYNPSAPLVIDPTIVYGTTLNLGDFDSGLDIATDSGGNAYVLGRVYDTNNDVLIAKLSPDGALLYATYLRGSALDFGGGITLDASGDIYVAGGTDSADFPILNAAQPVKNGVTRDAFIAKLAGGDGALLFSTFFGGSRSDEIHDITLNDGGEIYLVGYTESTDFPTVNPIQSGLNLNQCFCEDTFVTRLSPDAMTLLYSTYLGGSFEDYGQSIALDGSDNIYITGRTQSDDYPTLAAIQPNRAGTYQDEDLFVSKISASGSLVYSTYLGGTDLDSIRRLAVDSAGNAFLTGSTRSVDFPTTTGAYQENFIGGVDACGTAGFGGPVNCSDMFVTKIVPDGSALTYSTYLGGGLDDVATGIALNASGEAYLVGYTSSTDFPGVTRTGPGAEIAVAKMNASGSDLLYTVIIDSAVANGSNGITLDQAGDIYITAGQNAPSDLYVAKISEDEAAPPPPSPTPTPVPPTPTPAPSTSLHVGDLDGSSTWVFRKWYWQASVTIAVHDANHDPLSGATVSGAWSGGYSGSAQCTTGSDGRCALTTGNIWRKNRRVTFSVNDVTSSSFEYAAAENHDPDGDSNGAGIIVSRP
jgi:hypothetical protein